ncbi:MAG: PQQ-binding-like beta-propeller repeat protein [Alphaproteobacteria bacterium]|nr:PQQ-binding-like beta-propeller repeat protein [Alphaproteobacteria bacterium]
MRIKTHTARYAALCMIALMLTACSTAKEWMESSDDDSPARLPGERLRVMSTQSDIVVAADMATVEYRGVAPQNNVSWPQRGSTASNAVGALQIKGFETRQSAEIGEGNGWSTVLATAPVVAENVLYAMDALGYVSAHRADKLDKVLWMSDVPIANDDEEILGGGLAVAGSQLFIASGQGDIFSLNVNDGSQIWKRNIGSPMRSAPKIHMGVVYVATVDDQVFALDSATGNIVWQHRGLGERVGFLSAVSPAIGENIVVVAYSSGELYGLAADTGQEIWNDSLAVAHKTSATSVFTGFDGDPVVAGGMAFASSNNGVTAATHLLTGRRLWEQEVSAGDTPWLAGNFVFVLTEDAQIAAIYARDGRVKWVHKLKRFANPEKQLEPYSWYGPMMLNEQLAVFSGHGELVLLSPQDGAVIGTLEIPDPMSMAPIVADGTVFVVTGDAEIHALR